MSSSSKFVIGSDDDEMDQNLDSKQSCASDSDSNTNETLVRNNKYRINSYQQTSYETLSGAGDTYTTAKLNTHTADGHDDSTFVYEDEYKALCDMMDTSEYHRFQLLLHRIVYPLLWLCDASFIRHRPWLQIPFIQYMTRITSMIIGIALSQLIIRGYELKASAPYDLNDVIYFLSAYVVFITILCIAFLYFYYRYTHRFSPYHYNYFVQTCCGIIGYAILYLLVHIQDAFYSASLDDTFKCLAGASMFAISTVGVIIFIKQFVFDFSFKPVAGMMRIAQQEDEYESDEENPLLDVHSGGGDDDAYDVCDMMDKSIGDDDVRMLNEYKSKGVVWFTISCLTLDIWHISIGFVMIECVVYIFSGRYVNLLIDWTHDSSTAIHNIWNVVVFGFLLAFITGVVQIVLQMYCKSPLYEYQLQLTAMKDRAYHSLPHKEDLILFLLNWLHHITALWNKILSAAIGWSLLAPNQTNSSVKQFVTAITATLLFLFVAYCASDYKRRIQKDIVSEIREIGKQLRLRMDEEDMKRIAYNKQKFAFYDQLHATYDLAFAVSVSYSWESFIVIAVTNIFGSQSAFNRFVTHLILTLVIACVGAQLGLELVELKRQRVKEAKRRKLAINHLNYKTKQNINTQENIKLQISTNAPQKLLTSP